METDLVGPPLPPHFSQRSEAECLANQAEQLVVKPKNHAKKNGFGPFLHLHLWKVQISESKGTSSQQGNSNPDPVYFRKVDLSDLPSQYTEDMETFKQILNLPDRRDSMPRSSTTVWALNEVAGQQAKAKGPFSYATF